MAEMRASSPVSVPDDHAAGEAACESELLPLDDLYPMYPEEWVLAEVIDPKERGGQTLGRVLMHSRSRTEISEELYRVWRERPDILTSVFPGGSIIPSSVEEARELLAQAAGLGPLNAAW